MKEVTSSKKIKLLKNLHPKNKLKNFIKPSPLD